VPAGGPPPAGCAGGARMTLVEARGMDWSPDGYAPKDLPAMDRAKVLGLATAWARAYAAAGVDLVALPSLADAITGWGALSPVKPVPGQTFGRYDGDVLVALDAIVEAFDGRAVLVLSALCAWDHDQGVVPVDRKVFQDYVKAVVERYDGDTQFGVPAQDPGYPDIDGTGKVTPADWEAPDADKKAWAARHRVAAYMVESGSAPAGAARGDYAGIFGAAAEAAPAASKDVVLWMAPFDAPSMSKGEWNERFGALAPAGGAGGRVAVAVVSVPQLTADPTGEAAAQAFEGARKWFADASFAPGEAGGVTLVFGGIRTCHAGGQDAACKSLQASDDAQAEQVIKALALAATAGAGMAAFDGLFDPVSPQGSFGLGTLDLAATPAALTPRPALATMGVAARVLAPAGKAVEVPTGVPSTHVVQSAVCAGETDVLAWYDWTLEVGPGEPYGDLIKAVDLQAPADGSRAFLLSGAAKPEAVDLVEGAKVTVDLPGAGLPAGGEGYVKRSLGRTPVLVVTLDAGWPLPDTGPDASAPDAAGQDAGPLAATGGGSDGGCSVGSPCTGGAAAAFLALALLSMAARRRVG